MTSLVDLTVRLEGSVHTSSWQRAFISLFVLLVLFSLPRDGRALDDPRLEYETLTTPHFHIHYADGLDDLARKVAQSCEEAHEILSPLLDWEPASRTHVHVTDRLDVANGSAQVYGRNVINIYGMPPESDSVLGYYDDWIRILVYHEYVHILHLDTTSRLPSWINAVVGKLYNPNQLLPRWYIEGLATYHESARTGTGRVNSSLYQMWLRAELLSGEDNFSLGQVSNATTRWPFGSIVYLFGCFFIDWMGQRHGEAFLTEFNHLLGSRVVPYSMNQAAKQITGETFEEMWNIWVREARAEAEALARKVRARGETELEFITTQGGESKFPRVRPGHDEVAFYYNTLKRHARFAHTHIHRDAPEPRAHTRASADANAKVEAEVEGDFQVDAAAGTSNWFPDGERLIYSRRMIERNVYRYEDLFVRDMDSGTERRLTHAERAREPAISPDGRLLAYVRNRGGTMELVLRRVRDGGLYGKERVLISGLSHPWEEERHWQQIATPIFTPDGKGIVFSWWRLDLRQRDLWHYRLDGDGDLEERLTPLMRDEAMDIDPTFGPDGLLYFSSDRGGVYNIHAMDLDTRRVRKVSDVITGVFSPQITEDGEWVYVTTYTSRGYDIARFPLKQALANRASESGLRRQSWRRYPEITERDWEQGAYKPMAWLKPLFFFPEFGATTGGLGGGLTLLGADPMGRHAYEVSLGATYNSTFQQTQPSLGASYAYYGWPVNVSLNAAHRSYQNSRGLFAESRFIPYLEQQNFAQLRLTYPIASTRDSVALSLAYILDHRDYLTRPTVEFEPGDIEPVDPELGWFNQTSATLSYSWLERYPYSVSVERGITTALTASLRSPAIGSDYRSLSLNYSVLGFIPNPLVERHALALTMLGGVISSNFRNQLSYGMGGNGPQNVLQSIVFQGSSSSLVVRGYPQGIQRGTRYFLNSAEYRFPILDLERGFATVPFYLRQLKGRAFVDTGTAFNGYLADADLLVGVGGELVLTTLLGYYMGGTLRAGYARGLTGEDGGNDFYLLYGGGF